MSSSQPFPAIVRHLITIPRELIYQIFTNLPLFKILQLACFDIAYLDECILHHYHYQQLFTSPAQLADAKAHFKVYHSIYKSLQWSLSESSPLSLNVSSSAHLVNQQAICRYLHERIYSALQKALPHLALLSQFSSTPIPAVWDSSNITLLGNRWMAISGAQRAINETKAGQLKLMAEFKARYPDLLRFTSDIVDDRLKLNKEHMVERFRNDSRRVIQSRFMTRRLYVKYCFRHDIPPLVPYNWCLNLFLTVLEKNPIRDDEIMNANSNDGATLNVEQGGLTLLTLETTEVERLREPGSPTPAPPEASKEQNFPQPYPPQISRDIYTVVAGLPYVYTVPPPTHRSGPKIPRTKHTPYSVLRSGGNDRSPTFNTPPRVSGKVRRKSTRLQPHNGKEYEWLGAFLRCVEHMKGMLSEDERKELEKVGERERREAEGLMVNRKPTRTERRELRKVERQREKEQEEKAEKSKREGVQQHWGAQEWIFE